MHVGGITLQHAIETWHCHSMSIALHSLFGCIVVADAYYLPDKAIYLYDRSLVHLAVNHHHHLYYSYYLGPMSCYHAWQVVV